MPIINRPDEHIFASSAKQGEVEAFPNLSRGWGIAFEQTSGIPPMEWFNGLFNRIDQNNLYNLQRGLPEWSNTLEYPAGAYVQHQGKTYRSLREHRNQRPNTIGSTYWERWGFTLTEIGRASLAAAGIVQLTNDTGLDSEALALTAKAGKKLAQEIAKNRQKTVELANQKVNKSDVSDAVNSTSQTQVASSRGLKTAHDKALQAERLASLYSADVADNVHCDNVMDGLFVTRVGTPDGQICYVLNLKYKNSQSRGQIAISYWDATPKMWIRNKYDTETHFSAWRQIDGTDWESIRNKVNASTERYGLAKYSDDINLDSNDFAATPKAVKLLNDKKQDKLVQQTLDLTHLDSDKWYPVVLQMDSNNRRTYRFAIRTTLGESSATWGTHSVGFGVYLEWEAQPSGWGAWQGYDQMRVVHQFEVSHASQSPILKMGQLYEISGEYVHLRGGAKYTLYRESGVSVTLTGTDYRWEQVVSSNDIRRQHLPVLTHYDESLVPKTSRQAIKDSINDEMVGQVAFFASFTPPSGWLKANGAAVSRTTYAALFARIGIRFGVGDGSTTFNLPDLRGEFVRGWDDGRNIDAGRALGSHQGDAIRNITGEIQAGIEEAQGNGSGAFRTKNFGRRGGTGSYGDDGFTFDASRVVPTAHENRPRNIALLACIKY